MAEEKEYAIFDRRETVMESIYKDLFMFSLLGFCIWISQGSTWWTFVTGLFFILIVLAKISNAIKRYKTFKSKDELKAWVDKL